MKANLNRSLDLKALFLSLYNAKTEEEVSEIISQQPKVFKSDNWIPLGGDENMFGIVRNQQSNPIAALVEKVTNSIDAVLLKRCYEEKIDPKSSKAPKSMVKAIAKFYPHYEQWDLKNFRRKQSEEIQIIADGPPRNTSVIIYDNGEGQHPENFEDTFLSLVRGNKINIHFVQGKYNMGGSGALVFCGKKRYQLIGSRRWDETGNFGFTLIRQHRPNEAEGERRHSYFEYLKIDKDIPAFKSDDLDLKLHGRKFRTGSVIKMYSYQFPPGYAGFAQDLNQSLNEFLFEPVLPLLTVDKKERYPNNKVLELDLFGLKRKLEEDKHYVETSFSEEYEDQLFGKAKVTCYVFKPRVGDRDVKKTKEVIRERFFRNQKAVMFSINGQVQGGFTSEFITRTLKFDLLKHYLLIHVDCTGMRTEFREELFMASRDRLKDGEESVQLREYLGKRLRKSQLEDINNDRKDSIGIDTEDTNELIKSFAKNLPKDSDLFKLLQNTLKLDEKKDSGPKQTAIPAKEEKKIEEKEPFNPQRFPTFFKLHNALNGDRSAIAVPKEGEKVVKFNTDVENEYFDRKEEPGMLEIALLSYKQNEKSNGDKKKATQGELSSLLNIVKSSPRDGTIKISFNPTEEMNVGDEAEVKVSLTGAGHPFEEILWVKVKEKEAPKEEAPKKEEEESFENIGLPELRRVKRENWDKLEDKGIDMDHDTVMSPRGTGDVLEEVYINLDSRVFENHKKKLKSEKQLLAAEKRYVAAVYFHTIFLYMITKKKNYKLSIHQQGNDEDVTVGEYVQDVFNSYYSDFLLNFGMEELISSLEE